MNLQRSLGLIALLFLTSCRGPEEGLLLGDIRGTIHLFPQQHAKNLSKGIVLVPSIKRSTVSDSDGTWILHDVPFGVYDIFVTGSEVNNLQYDTLPYYSIICSGGLTTVPDGYLAPNPAAKITLDSVVQVVSYGVAAYVSKEEDSLGWFLIIDTLQDVPLKSAHALSPLIGTPHGVSGQTRFGEGFPIDSNVIHHGTNLFIRVCTTDQYWTSSNQSFGIHNPITNQDQIIEHGPVSKTYEFLFK